MIPFAPPQPPNLHALQALLNQRRPMRERLPIDFPGNVSFGGTQGGGQTLADILGFGVGGFGLNGFGA